jgi:undecaprenyl-diphosphatase
LGSTFDGSYEPIADVCTALDQYQADTGLDIPVHEGIGGLRPVTMERTLEVVGQELAIVDHNTPPLRHPREPAVGQSDGPAHQPAAARTELGTPASTELLTSLDAVTSSRRQRISAAGPPDPGALRRHPGGGRPRPASRLLRLLRRRLGEVVTVNFAWLVVAGAGVGVLSASIVAAARGETISPAESWVFHSINGLPDWLYWFLWPPMQLGNLVVGTAAGLAVAVADGDVVIGSGVLLAAALKLVTERIVRKETADALFIRQRPGTSQDGAIRRGGDVPSSGPSFPSGHVILVAAIGCVVAADVSVTWWWVPISLTALVMLGRIYVGAHNPLDVTAGLGAGLLLGGALAVLVN